MTHHDGGLNAQTLPEAREGILDDEDGGLGEERILEGNLGSFLVTGLGIEKFAEVPAKVWFERFAAIVDNSAEKRLVAIEVQTHVDVLGALPAKKEDNGRIASLTLLAAAAQRIGLEEKPGRFAGIRGDHEAPVGHLLAAGLKCVRRIWKAFRWGSG